MADGPAYITIPFRDRSVFRKLFEMECGNRLILWRWAYDQWNWIWQLPMNEEETKRKDYNATLLNRIRALGFSIQGRMVTPTDDVEMCLTDLMADDMVDLGMTPEEAEAKYVNRMILSSFGIPIVEIRGEMIKHHNNKYTDAGRIEIRWLTDTMGQFYFKGHIAEIVNVLKEFAGISAANVNKRFEDIKKRYNTMPRISGQKDLPIEVSKIIRAGLDPSAKPKNDPGYALARRTRKRKTRKYKKSRSRK